MNREQLMSVLIAPHVTEKTSLAMQNHNQYTFRVRRDATKTDIKKAVELMFDVKVAGVQVVNEPGKTRRFGKTVGPHAGLEEGLRESGRRPDDRLRSAREGLRLNMASSNTSRRSPGTRSVVKVDRSHLHKGGPREPLTAHAEQDRRAQPLRPHHHAPPRRRLAPEVPHHRLQARQGRHRRCRRAPRVRSEPHQPHRADQVRGRRAPLHPRAQGREARRRGPLGRRCADQVGQRHGAAAHPGRLDQCTTWR